MGLTNVVEQLQTTAIIERSNSGMNPGTSGWSRPTENNVAHNFGAMTAADFLGNDSGSLLRSLAQRYYKSNQRADRQALRR